MRDGGKGDKPRPFSIGLEKFDTQWEMIFGKKEKKETNLEPIPFAGYVDTGEDDDNTERSA